MGNIKLRSTSIHDCSWSYFLNENHHSILVQLIHPIMPRQNENMKGPFGSRNIFGHLFHKKRKWKHFSCFSFSAILKTHSVSQNENFLQKRKFSTPVWWFNKIKYKKKKGSFPYLTKKVQSNINVFSFWTENSETPERYLINKNKVTAYSFENFSIIPPKTVSVMFSFTYENIIENLKFSIKETGPRVPKHDFK